MFEYLLVCSSTISLNFICMFAHSALSNRGLPRAPSTKLVSECHTFRRDAATWAVVATEPGISMSTQSTVRWCVLFDVLPEYHCHIRLRIRLDEDRNPFLSSARRSGRREECATWRPERTPDIATPTSYFHAVSHAETRAATTEILAAASQVLLHPRARSWRSPDTLIFK